MVKLQKNTTRFPRWNHDRIKPEPITYSRLVIDFNRSFQIKTLASDRAWMLHYNTHNEKRRGINILS